MCGKLRNAIQVGTGNVRANAVYVTRLPEWRLDVQHCMALLPQSLGAPRAKKPLLLILTDPGFPSLCGFFCPPFWKRLNGCLLLPLSSQTASLAQCPVFPHALHVDFAFTASTRFFLSSRLSSLVACTGVRALPPSLRRPLRPRGRRRPSVHRTQPPHRSPPHPR